MKLYIEDIFVEYFFYSMDYGIAYSLENSQMGFVLTPFLDKNLLNVEIKEEKCIISIPQNIPLVKVEHISDFCYEAQIPYDSSFTYLTYYHMFSLLYSLYMEYDEYVKPFFLRMLEKNPVLEHDTIFPGTLIELKKCENEYKIKIINAEG
jgi:hypothetical protein